MFVRVGHNNADYYAIGYIKNEEATKLARGFIPDDMWIAGPALHISHDDFKPITHVDDLPEALKEYRKEESRNGTQMRGCTYS